tara:strand:- start:1275 stop:2207 length:933 start_codon:yes stop_codon:yes gene_type:complete
MKVLVIQQRYGIGDMVIFSPYIQAISKKCGVPVSILAKKSSKASEIFSEDNSVNEIIDLEKSLDTIRGFFKISKILKEKNFDRVYIFNGSLRYNLIAKHAGIKSIFQYPLFTSKDIIFQTAKIFTENSIGEIVDTQPSIKTDKKKSDMIFDKNYKHIILGLSASGETKRWGVNNFVKVTNKVSREYKCKFYLAGGSSDQKIIDEFISKSESKNFFSFTNLNIKEIISIIKYADFYLGNDTGFMHISSALGVRCIGIFIDSPAYAYSGYTKNIEAIVPRGETINSTTHNTNGRDKISSDDVIQKVLKYITK